MPAPDVSNIGCSEDMKYYCSYSPVQRHKTTHKIFRKYQSDIAEKPADKQYVNASQHFFMICFDRIAALQGYFITKN